MKEKHSTYFNLLDAFKEGCPLCHLIGDNVHKFIENFLYESVNDPGARKNLRASLGFCNAHSWALRSFGDALGSSIVYEDLIAAAVHRFQKLTTSLKDIKGLLSEFTRDNKPGVFGKRKATCPACKVGSEAERNYISAFMDYFYEPEFKALFKSSFGLCLPHLLRVLEKCRGAKVADEIKSIELEKLSALIKEAIEHYERF